MVVGCAVVMTLAAIETVAYAKEKGSSVAVGGNGAAGLAQINAISNLAGFGTTYVMGFIKDATGSFSLALVPLVALAATGAWAILWIGRGQRPAALREGKAVGTC